MVRRVLVPVVCAFVLSSCAAHTKPAAAPARCPSRDTHERLNGVLWMQTSAEYQALAAVTYREATDHVLSLVKQIRAGKPVASAALEQKGRNSGKLPLAVIVDVDETILDNSPISGELIERRIGWDKNLWKCWVEMRRAEFVAGADAFVQAMESKDVEVFYITNRKDHEQAATLVDLEPLGATPDTLLASGEQVPGKAGETWPDEKESRRAYVAQKYWVVALVGDDLADFIPGVRKDVTAEYRLAEMKKRLDLFGTRWFLLPNPVYGSWEAAVVKSPGDAEQLKEKHDRIERMPKVKKPPEACQMPAGTPVAAPASMPES
jgi:5'-nucleotidase (lipoprotein e(P4) family)